MEGRGMSKKKAETKNLKAFQEASLIRSDDVPADIPPGFCPRDKCNRVIEPERFCPICWGRFRGYGTSDKTSQQGTRYYKCNRTVPGSEFGPCGYSWSLTFDEITAIQKRYTQQLQAELVTYRRVILDGQR